MNGAERQRQVTVVSDDDNDDNNDNDNDEQRRDERPETTVRAHTLYPGLVCVLVTTTISYGMKDCVKADRLKD